MRTSALHDFAKDWPASIAELVEAAITSGEIEGAELRTIVLAPTRDRQRLGVWLGLEWEDYPYAENTERATGFVSLSGWLDEVDAVARGERTFDVPAYVPRAPIGFEDPARNEAWRGCWARLHQAISATIDAVATKLLATRFKQPVGVFLTMDGAEARLMAFCHPAGAPLLAIKERRKEHGFGSVYPQAALIDDGFVVFYPEGEGESLGNKGGAAIHTYRFADMVKVVIDDDGESSIRFKGEVFDVKFEAGHTHEEHGGLDRGQVNAALSAHLKKSGRVVEPSAALASLPTSAADLGAFLDQLSEDHEKANAIEALAERHGIGKILPLAAACGLSPKVADRYHSSLARTLVREGKPAEALELLGKLSGEDREEVLEARALLALGRYGDAIKAGGKEDRARPYVALAQLGLGKHKEALKIVSEETRDEDLLAARALVLAKARDPGASSALREAFLEGSIEPDVLSVVKSDPILGPIVAAKEAIEKKRASSRASLEALPVGAIPSGREVELSSAPVEAWSAPLAAPEPEKKPKKTKTKAKKEDRPAKLRVGIAHGADVWVGNDQGAVASIRADGTVQPIAQLHTNRIEALVPVRGGVVISDGTRMLLVDDAGAERGRAQGWDRGDGPVAASGALVAKAGNGSIEGVDLYWAEGGLQHLSVIGLPKSEYIEDLAIIGSRLVVIARDVLSIFDVTDPKQPTPVLRARGQGSLSLAGVRADLIVLKDDSRMSVLRVGATLTALCSAPIEGELTAIPSGDRGFGLVSRGKFWRLDPEAPQSAQLELLFGSDGYPLEPRAFFATAESRTALTDEGLVALQSVPLGVEAIEQRVDAHAARLQAWAATQAEAHLGPEQPGFGAIRVLWVDRFARLEALPPVSAASLGLEPVWVEELSFEEEGEAAEKEEIPAAAQRGRSIQHGQQQIAVARRSRALGKILGDLGRSIAPRVAARDLLLVRYDERSDRERIVGVLPGGGAATPARTAITKKGPKSTRDRLAAYDWYREREALVSKAKRDPEFRAEVLKLLVEERLTSTARIAEELGASPEVISAWLAVAETDPAFAIDGLMDHPTEPRVRAKLMSFAELDDPDVALPARRALGRLDDDRTVALLRAYLATIGVDRDGGEVPENTLAALPERRLRELASDLRGAYDRLKDQHHRSDELLIPMARAGVWIPERLEDALRERRDEALGEGWLPSSMMEETPVLGALRHHLADRIAAKLATPDDGEPLWPNDVPPEAHRGGWQRFFDVAWKKWEAAGLLDVLHERLPQKAMAPSVMNDEGENELPADAKLALQTLLQDLLRGDRRGEVLGRALEAAPYEGNALKDVVKLAQLSRVQYGWSLSKEKRYAEARKVADAALADAPDDGQVRFFEARLAWLEKDDPEEAIRRIPKALEKAGDPEGRGRLFNLYGAALDAQGKFADSIGWFEKAMAADPSQAAMFLSNIAEAHWKGGAKADALAFAQKAARRGSTTEIVKTILASATGESTGAG